MSSDYAGRLSEYAHKGICGLPEIQDSSRSMDHKMSKLLKLMKESENIVVLTGAGISTNAGIPDFRGPNGVWTAEDKEKKTSKQKRRRKSTNPDCDHQSISQALEQTKDQTKDLKKRPRGEENITSKAVSFDNAKPTTTHYALTRLVEKGIISHVITQNVDGLHLRSGLPRSKLSVLHGCIFTEKCEKCDKEFFRNFDIGGVGFKKTGRICDVTACNGDLRDTVLDWEDELPEADWETSQNYCEMSDLVLTLGTSLRIEPAGSLPTLAKQFVIINKQVTPYDIKAALHIRGDVDSIFERIMKEFDEEWEK